MKKYENSRGYQPNTIIAEGYKPITKLDKKQPPNQGSAVKLPEIQTTKNKK